MTTCRETFAQEDTYLNVIPSEAGTAERGIPMMSEENTAAGPHSAPRADAPPLAPCPLGRPKGRRGRRAWRPATCGAPNGVEDGDLRPWGARPRRSDPWGRPPLAACRGRRDVETEGAKSGLARATGRRASHPEGDRASSRFASRFASRRGPRRGACRRALGAKSNQETAAAPRELRARGELVRCPGRTCPSSRLVIEVDAPMTPERAKG